MDSTRRDDRVLPLPLPLPPPAASGPARLGPFRVERELARGGMGVVYAAFHEGLGRRVALKLLRAGQGADPEEVERFRFEAQAAARLKHPHIVGIHDVGRTADGWYLAMDLVEGESLQARIAREGALPPEEAARLLEVIARAVHYAHGRGILHRDLKPHNVLLDAQGAPHLADFGLAKDASRAEAGLTVTGQVLGTPAYMSPEQASGDPALVDRRSDVWGLGATLYAALTGRPPYEGASVVNIIAALSSRDPRPASRLRPGLDRDLETVVMTCLERDPARRYASAEAVAADLARWQRDEPLQARRAGPLTRLAKWTRRNRALALTVGGALTLVVATSAGAVAWVVWERAASSRATIAAARQQAEVHAGELARSANTGAALRTLQAAERWHALAPDDPAARAAHRDAALRLSDLARATRQWDLALAAADVARPLAPEAADDRRAGALAARDAEERAHVNAARAVLDRVARGEVEGEAARFDAAFELAQHASPATIALLVERLDALTALAVQGHLLAATEREASRVVCEVLGRIGRGLERVEDALVAHLDAVEDEAVALAAGRALVHLGTSRGVEAALAAVERFGRKSPVGAGLTRAMGRLPDLAALLPPSTDAAGSTLDRIGVLAAAGDLERARHEAATLAGQQPGNARGLHAVALVELLRGALDDAEAAATRALELDPTFAPALHVRGLARVRRGDLEAALGDALAAVELEPTLEHVRGLADVRAFRGEHREALELLDRLLTSAPTDLALRHVRVQLLLQTGEHRRALDDADAVLVALPHDAKARHARGRALMALGQVDEGLTELARAVEDAPSFFEGWADLGLARWEAARDLAGATSAWERALALRPESAVVWANRGHARLESGDLAGARADLDRALELDPTLAQARFERAGLRARGGDTAGALEDVDVVVAAQPGSSSAHLARGKLRLRLGNPTGAEADFARAIELAPGAPEAYTGRGAARLSRGDARAALDDLDRALAIHPTAADALATRGQVKLTLGDAAGAAADFERFLEVAPAHPRAGDVRRALEQLRSR